MENHHHHHHDDDDGRRCCRVRDGARRASDRPSRVPPPPRVVFDRVTARDDPVLDGVSPRAPSRDALSSRVETHTHSRPSSSSFVFGGRSAAAVSRTAMALIGGTTMSLMTFGTSTYHAFTWRCRACLLKACAYMGKGKGWGAVTFLWSFGYLVWVHYDADSGSEWKRGNIDITGLLMVLTLKVTSSAMNFEDYGLGAGEIIVHETTRVKRKRRRRWSI